jgi:hypothetical protein
MVTYIILMDILSGKASDRISVQNQVDLTTSGIESRSGHAGAAFEVLSIDLVSFP